MSLFSEIDWIILLGVAAFLLFGQENGAILRTLGRYYGRAMRLKQDLLSEFTQAADLPPSSPGSPMSVRQALIGWAGTSASPPGVPVAVSTPPVPLAATPGPVPPGIVSGTWSIAVASIPVEPPGAR